MGTPPPLPEPVRGLRLEERAPSITTLIVDAVKAVSSTSAGPVCGSDLLTAVQVDVSGMQPTRFAGFAADAPNIPGRPNMSPFAVASAGDQSPSKRTAAIADAESQHRPQNELAGSHTNAELLSEFQRPESVRLPVPCAPSESGNVHASHGAIAPSLNSPEQYHAAVGADRAAKQLFELAEPPPLPAHGPISPHHCISASFQGHPWDHIVEEASTGSHCGGQRLSDSAVLALPLSDPSQVSDAPSSGSLHLLPHAIAATAGGNNCDNVLSAAAAQRLRAMLPGVMQGLLPSLLSALLPAAAAAALPAASSAAAAVGAAAVESALPAVLEAALPQALATALPRAIAATFNVLVKAAAGNDGSHPDADGAASIATGERQQSLFLPLEHQCAAEAQMVRMLFGADSLELPPQQQKPKSVAVVPCVIDVAAAIASGGSSPSSGPASRAGSPTGSAAATSPSDPQLKSRPSSFPAAAAVSASAAAAELQDGECAERPPPLRRPSVAAFAGGPAASLSTAVGEMFSRRLSDTNHSTGAAAPPSAATAARPTVTVKVPGRTGGKQQQAFCRSSCSGGGGGGHSTPSLGHPEDGVSSVDDALSTCSGDMPSPYTSIAAVHSGATRFLMAGGSTVDVGGGVDAMTTVGLYGMSGDALLNTLHQVQQQQQHRCNATASPAELLLAATAGGSLRGVPGDGSALASQLVQQPQSSQAAAAAAAALYVQQQQAQQQRVQQQQQQEAQVAAACAQQLQQLQQLQALVSGRSLSEQDLAMTPSPPLGTASGGGGANLAWRRSSADVTFGAASAGSDLWQQQQSDSDALGFAAAAQFAQLSQQQQQQQQQQQAIAAAGLLQQQQQQQQQQQLLAQSLAAVAAANAAGRAVRAEDFLAFGTGGSATPVQLPAANAGLGNQTAAAQLAVAAAAAGGSGATAPATAADLASYMDAALRRMLLVSPQVAAEMARACGAFSGAHAQLHHLCCVIAEQLLDVAAMAPEVAAALLRALAAQRARGAQATDVDPRVMGRVLQLLRAGPAGRQLCLVSLEQWVDGLSRIHKRRAYLDTILHNYQLTLKRLVQAMGHQVHAVNMSLPRQLLNDLSPRALLLLTAELAPYPLLQPRRWSEEIIWTVTQMHAMGMDMPASTVAAAAAAVGAAAAQAATSSAFQWEIRRALAATAEDIAAAGGGATAAGGQSPPGAGPLAELAGLAGLAGGAGAGSAASGSTTPGGTAVPWAAHAALHRHLLMGLRRIQSRFFSDRLRKMHGLYGDSVEALLRSSLPQDVLVPEREAVVLVAVLLMLECRMRPEDFDAAFGRDLQRCLAVSSAEEVAARLRCGLVPDSALRLDPHKSRALSQLLKLGVLPGQAHF